MTGPRTNDTRIGLGRACGKVILLGEHAVDYGVPAIAVGVDRGARAKAEALEGGPSRLHVRGWNIDTDEADGAHDLGRAFRALLDASRSASRPLPSVRVEVEADLPPGGGLGCSAAMGVAIARAVDSACHRRAAPRARHGVGAGLPRQPERRRRRRRRAGRLLVFPPRRSGRAGPRARGFAPLHRQHGHRLEHQDDGRRRRAPEGAAAARRRDLLRRRALSGPRRPRGDPGGRSLRPRPADGSQPDAPRRALRVDAGHRPDVLPRARRRRPRREAHRRRRRRKRGRPRGVRVGVGGGAPSVERRRASKASRPPSRRRPVARAFRRASRRREPKPPPLPTPTLP